MKPAGNGARCGRKSGFYLNYYGANDLQLRTAREPWFALNATRPIGKGGNTAC
jgi:hypothetical protein